MDRLSSASSREFSPPLVRPLDQHWEDEIEKVLAKDDPDTQVVKAADGTWLTRHDFASLLPRSSGEDESVGWLNDNIVHAFTAALVQRKQERDGMTEITNDPPIFQTFHPGWYRTYKTAGVAKLRPWSAKKRIEGPGLLNVEQMFLPLSSNGHWKLLVVRPKERSVDFLDSLRGERHTYFNIARDWLRMELGELYRAEEWTDSRHDAIVQENSRDCGVFVLMNALAAAKQRPYSEVDGTEMHAARRMVAAILLNGGFTEEWEL